MRLSLLESSEGQMSDEKRKRKDGKREKRSSLCFMLYKEIHAFSDRGHEDAVLVNDYFKSQPKITNSQ